MFDHPLFNWVLAKNVKNKYYQTKGRIRLVPMRQKDLFIMEDINERGFRAQNFVFASREMSDHFIKLATRRWVLEHLFEFVTKSISIFYLLVFYVAQMYVQRHYGVLGLVQLGILFGPPGMVLLPTLYYAFWSSRTHSSFLKFFFRFELMLMLVFALVYILFFIVFSEYSASP